MEITTNKKGNIGLIKVMLDLTMKGYFIFTPISDTTCVDLIASDEKMNLKKFQIKYKTLNNGCLTIRTSSVVNGKNIPIDLTKIDIWAIYCKDNDKVYYIPSNMLIGKTRIKLRVDKPKTSMKTIIYASNYEKIDYLWV
jgi:hypothetical protein